MKKIYKLFSLASIAMLSLTVVVSCAQTYKAPLTEEEKKKWRLNNIFLNIDF